jgi:xanthine dehydrogenase YagR molybdenum-binding subunit
MTTAQRIFGAPIDRVDGPLKVTGAATYAYEHPVEGAAHAAGVLSTIAKGRIVSIDATAALALDGVTAVLWHDNAPRLQSEDPELQVLQSDDVAFRGQFVAAVVADTPEIARHAAALVEVQYEEEPHDVVLSADRDDLDVPPGDDADSDDGDVEAGYRAASWLIATPTRRRPSTTTRSRRTRRSRPGTAAAGSRSTTPTRGRTRSATTWPRPSGSRPSRCA